MKKLLLALALLLAPSAVFAQCNGVFANNTVCGNVSGSTNLPRPTATSAFPSVPGGSNGQVQYNNSGALGGFTASGDATINTSTGVVTLNPIANNSVLSNISGSSAHPIANTPTAWFDSAYCNTVGYLIVRLTSVWTCSNSYPRNIVWFGGDPTGVAATDTPFTNAYASLSNIGGAIYFPTGNYSFTSAVSKTLPNAQFSIMLMGDGANASTLLWPNASGGIQFTASNLKNNFHIRDMTIATSQVGSGNGLKMVGAGCNGGCEWQSDIANVIVQGFDFSTSSSDYWANAVWLHNWGGVNIYNLTTNGPHAAPGTAGGGIGLLFEGNSGTSSYATILNVTNSNFNFHNIGLELGDFWQGVAINQTNFNGQEGGACIQQNAGATGALVEIEITSSQFNCAGQQVSFLSPVINSTFMGNTISITGNGNSGIIIAAGSSGLIVIGNAFNQTGAYTGTFCVVYAGAVGVIMGNTFSQCATPVNLQAASSNIGVSQNRYITTTSASNINSGSGNNMGTVTQ